MAVKPNLFERTAVYTLNAVPDPILAPAGLFAYPVVTSAVNVTIATL